MTNRLFHLAAVVAVFGIAVGWSLTAGAQDPSAAGTVCGPAGQGMPGACGGSGGTCRPWEYGNPDLFYNFYMGNNCGGVPAAMYVAPHPVPPVVGQTSFTYQPLMPHEFMYPHYRTYRKPYDDGRGIDRTKVVWYSNPVATVLKDVRCAIKLPR